MGTSLWYHQHAVVGITIHYSILPPFVLPTPVATVALPAFTKAEKGKVSFSDHGHDLPSLPSLSFSQKQMLGLTFLTHGHEEEGEGIDLEGAFTSALTFLPPPWSVV